MNEEQFRNKLISLLETHTSEYKMAESASAYISQCVAIRQNLDRRTDKISKRLTRKLERLKTGLSLTAQPKTKKANQLLQSYYRQAKTGRNYPGAADQVIGLLSDNDSIKEEFLNDVKIYFDGLKVLAEKERRMIAIDSFIKNVENGNLDELKQSKTEISSDDIWIKYWRLRNNGIKTEPAFKEVKDWLLDDLNLTKKEVKERFNITLEYQSFTRSANNQNHIKQNL